MIDGGAGGLDRPHDGQGGCPHGAGAHGFRRPRVVPRRAGGVAVTSAGGRRRDGVRLEPARRTQK